MKSIKIIIIINILFIYGCMDSNYKDEIEYYQNYRNKPLTKKEEKFKEHLEKEGFYNINIQPSTISVDLAGVASYEISLNSKINFSPALKDSIWGINKKIAQELYQNVIEDSLLYDIGSLNVFLFVSDSSTKVQKKIFRLYSKKEMEQITGFKVLLIGKNTFMRSYL